MPDLFDASLPAQAGARIPPMTSPGQSLAEAANFADIQSQKKLRDAEVQRLGEEEKTRQDARETDAQVKAAFQFATQPDPVTGKLVTDNEKVWGTLRKNNQPQAAAALEKGYWQTQVENAKNEGDMAVAMGRKIDLLDKMLNSVRDQGTQNAVKIAMRNVDPGLGGAMADMLGQTYNPELLNAALATSKEHQQSIKRQAEANKAQQDYTNAQLETKTKGLVNQETELKVANLGKAFISSTLSAADPKDTSGQQYAQLYGHLQDTLSAANKSLLDLYPKPEDWKADGSTLAAVRKIGQTEAERQTQARDAATAVNQAGDLAVKQGELAVKQKTAAATEAAGQGVDTTALRPDPKTANTPDSRIGGLTPNSVYQAGAAYALRGVLPPMGIGSSPVVNAKRNAIMNKGSALAAAAGVDLPTLQAEYKSNSAALGKIVPIFTMTSAAAQTANDNLGLALDQSVNVPRGASPMANKFKQWIQDPSTGLVGDPALAKFQTYIYTAAREYAKVTSGSAASVQGLTDSASAQVDKLLNARQNPDSFAAVAQAMQQDMGNVTKNQLKQINGTSDTIGRFLSATTGTPLPQGGGAFDVTDPTGKVHSFETQAQADAFKKLAGIK